MSPFDLVFAVYGLLLGLAVAEVLGGFSRSLKLKRGAKPVRVGWLTPLLGIFVMIDLTTFWLLAWEARDQIQLDFLTLVFVLAIVGTYYLAATLIFPDEPEEWPDFDAWYDKQNQWVIGGLLIANIGSWIGQIVLEEMKPSVAAELELTTSDIVGLWSGLGVLVLLIALLKVSNRRANVAMLAIAIVLLVVVGITGV